MISPFVIMLLFWLSVAGAILGGLGGIAYAFMVGPNMLASIGIAVGALVTIPFSILLYRLFAEIAILTFRIHERLTEIKNLLEKQNRSKG